MTLPDGTTQEVLAPVVYLSRAHAGDLQLTGSLMSGENIRLTTQGSMENSGTLLAANHLIVTAQDLVNRGQLEAGGDAALTASHDFTNQGSISATRVAILAGNDATFQSTTRDTAGLTGTATRLDTISTVTADQLTVAAGRDLSLQGAQIKGGTWTCRR